MKIGTIFNVGILLGACGLTYHLTNTYNNQELTAAAVSAEQDNKNVMNELQDSLEHWKAKHSTADKRIKEITAELENEKSEYSRLQAEFDSEKKNTKNCDQDRDAAIQQMKSETDTCEKDLAQLRSTLEKVKENAKLNDVTSLKQNLEAKHQEEISKLHSKYQKQIESHQSQVEQAKEEHSAKVESVHAKLREMKQHVDTMMAELNV